MRLVADLYRKEGYAEVLVRRLSRSGGEAPCAGGEHRARQVL